MSRLDHINLVVADLERAAHFYEHVFGWQRGFAAELNGAWIERVSGLQGVRASCLFLLSPQGGARIELIRYDMPAGARFEENSLANTFGARHIAFEVESIEDTLCKLSELGLKPLGSVEEVPFRVGNLGAKRLVYFHDFDGVLVEAAAYSAPSS
jgi:catechol 2,3-dioxygenase-like lactoylglutathione lyase family enzyme